FLHRPLDGDTTATAVRGSVLRAATEAYPTRRALSERLADLYGASLAVGSERLGDRLVVGAGMEWPVAGLPGARGLLGEGLAMLGEVLARPLRGAGGALDAAIVATEVTNHARALRALRDDKGRYALRRAIELSCAGEPYAQGAEGRLEDLPGVTPPRLAALHAGLLARAPGEIYVVGDVGVDEAERAVRRHLLWPGRAPRPWTLASPVGVHAARARPLQRAEPDSVAQGKLVLVFRAPVGAGHALAPAAHTLAGVLGGGPYARLFKVVRETHGLCYYANAGWNEAKGLMVVQVGIDPRHRARVVRLVRELAAEVGRGVLEPEALRGLQQAATHRVASLADNRGARIGFDHESLALGRERSPQGWLRRLLGVRPAEVRAVGRRLRLDTVFFLGSARAAAAGKGGSR
ncbi:MAG: M16 family metallopeptidase, partial [Planctomycetia bacterium]